jgi:transposase
MRSSYKITAEEAAEIRKKMKHTKNAVACRRMEAVALLGEGKSAEEVGKIKKYNPKYVRTLGLTYHRIGLEAFSVDRRIGGNHKVMTDAEAAKFLQQFADDASEGKLLTVQEIADALDKKTGKERKSRSTAYSFLHRHNWRKVMPRSKHPNKASDEEIDSSKKLTLKSGK